MLDRALGKTKAMRAGLTPPNRSRVVEFRSVGYGSAGAVKDQKGRYEVSEQAQDILNKQLRTYNR